jgi:hypothetical protein
VARRFWFETPAGNYRAGACVISCFDARFELVTRKFVKRRGVVLADHVRVAGGARALASPEGDSAAFLVGQVRLSMRLHGTDRVILVAHSDCGAYGGLEAFGGDADREQAAHRADVVQLPRAQQLVPADPLQHRLGRARPALGLVELPFLIAEDVDQLGEAQPRIDGAGCNSREQDGADPKAETADTQAAEGVAECGNHEQQENRVLGKELDHGPVSCTRARARGKAVEWGRMKRDPAFHALSTDHHHALVLARRVGEQRAAGAAGAELAALLAEPWRNAIEPHFIVEEELLLPPLAAAGETELVERTRREHAELRGLASAACAGDADAAGRFAAALEAHVRFEERELFAACEHRLDRATLERLAAQGVTP